jgi:hypothetical protein
VNRPALALASLVALASTACHNPGPYGFASKYAPLDAEEEATARAADYDPVMFQRDAEGWRKRRASLFGVVAARGAGPGGGAYVRLSVRRLEPRNLCDSANDEDSCRVTVSDKDFGVVHAVVALRPEDDFGEHSLGPGSLVRVVGRFGQELDPNDGQPVMRAEYYRHWPRNYYVTRASAEHMRQ